MDDRFEEISEPLFVTVKKSDGFMILKKQFIGMVHMSA